MGIGSDIRRSKPTPSPVLIFRSNGGNFEISSQDVMTQTLDDAVRSRSSSTKCLAIALRSKSMALNAGEGGKWARMSMTPLTQGPRSKCA